MDQPQNGTVEFSKTTFYRGMNATFGKLPIYLEVDWNVCREQVGERQPSREWIKVGLSAGVDVGSTSPSPTWHRVKHMDRFLESFQCGQPYRFNKNFIFEPDNMYFTRADAKLLEALYGLRGDFSTMEGGRGNHSFEEDLLAGEILLGEKEVERLLDSLWGSVRAIKWSKQSPPIDFLEDVDVRVRVEKKRDAYVMSVDYSQCGDFEPLTSNYRYVFLKDSHAVVRLSDEKCELFRNLYAHGNQAHKVLFTISESEKRMFQKNFLEPYSDKLGVVTDKRVKKDLEEGALLTKVYFDMATGGVISKLEFCYGPRVVNPLNDWEADKGFRDWDGEQKARDALKAYGFKEQGRLYLLDDVEKIMLMLTDRLTGLKRLAEVYYSQDFKKLSVKNLNTLDFSLSDDESVIYMDIHLDEVTDEELVELLDAVKKGKRYYRLRNGSIVNLGSVDGQRFIHLLQSLDIGKDAIRNGLFEIPVSRSLFLDNHLKENGMEHVKMDDRLGCLIRRITHPEDMELQLSDSLRAVLRDYQLVGVEWLQNMANYSFGGIFADDMGLGKTIQVLAFLSHEKNKRGMEGSGGGEAAPPSIVVAPPSVIYNWKREAEKFVPELDVLVIAGTKDGRRLLLEGGQRCDLLVTSYGMLKNDLETYQTMRFLYVFLDEAQNIKNPTTLNANSVKCLTSKCAFALTGTPIENRLSEIWSLFDFVMPGLLFTRTKFANMYEIPITKESNTAKREELLSVIRPFMIRRTKKDVLEELPDKIETNYLSEMTEEQKKLYVAFYKDFTNELLPQIELHGLAKNQLVVLTALIRLRQICAHPASFVEGYQGGSGKLDMAMDIIRESMDAGHSVLLFSQFTSVLKIIRKELGWKGVNYYYLDGTMKPEDRLEEVENFNSDREAVFLISLKAGGLGLNLTKADVVIHFDPWWNPAVEEQASDRAHRMGQKNVVQVYSLLTEGTIEEKMAALKEKKKELFHHFVRSEENLLGSLTEEEVRNLFAK